MISEWLLDLFQALFEALLSPLPDDTLNIAERIGDVAENLGALNYFLPIAETVTLVVGVFAVFPIFLGITLGLWVAAQLRGSSSVG